MGKGKEGITEVMDATTMETRKRRIKKILITEKATKNLVLKVQIQYIRELLIAMVLSATLVQFLEVVGTFQCASIGEEYDAQRSSALEAFYGTCLAYKHTRAHTSLLYKRQEARLVRCRLDRMVRCCYRHFNMKKVANLSLSILYSLYASSSYCHTLVLTT